MADDEQSGSEGTAGKGSVPPTERPEAQDMARKRAALKDALSGVSPEQAAAAAQAASAAEETAKDAVREAVLEHFSKAEEESEKFTNKLAGYGEAVWLMTQMATHKHMFLSDLDWLIQPPIALGQMRLFHERKVPVAFVTWALLDEEVEQRVISGNIRLKPGDWNSGDRPWLMDVVCPFGGTQKVIDETKKAVFPDRTVKIVVPDPEGKGTRVVEL